MPSPSAASPIPAAAGPRKKRSRIMQSSLELVFSYSRSQQLRYGQHMGSAPSFVQRSSQSWSSPGIPTAVRAGDSSTDDELAEEDADEEDDSPKSSPGDAGHRKDSEVAVIFAPDPVSSPEQVSAFSSSSHWERPTSNGGPSRDQSSHSSPSAGILNLLKRDMPPLPHRNTSRPSSRTVTPQTTRRDLSPTSTPVATEGTPLSKPDDAKVRTYSQASRRRSSIRASGSGRRPSVIRQTGEEVLKSILEAKRKTMVKGGSTDGQTLFNAVAVLLGIGILSMPLAFAYSGWIGGTALLVGFAAITCHTAKLLARLIEADSALTGYTDLAKMAFGRNGSVLITILFCLELFAFGVALVVLFGDTLEMLYPRISTNTYKIIGFALMFPTTLLPLSVLSLPSLLSTMSCVLLVVFILIDGFVKTSPPGSILHPATTTLWPQIANGNWLGGVGLILAGFGGHAVVPSLARDMRHPEHFDRVINQAFAVAATVSFVSGAAGYLMIGPGVSDEITKDLLRPSYGYPKVLNIFALWMIVVIPLTKFGLCSRPLHNTVEGLFGIDPIVNLRRATLIDSNILVNESPLASILESQPDSDGEAGDSAPVSRNPGIRRRSSASQLDAHASSRSERRKGLWRIFSRLLVTGACTLTAILLPGFEKVMAFLGSFECFAICIILPLGFYLRLAPILLPERRNRYLRAFHWFVLALSTVLMIGGTVWAFFPRQ